MAGRGATARPRNQRSDAPATRGDWNGACTAHDPAEDRAGPTGARTRTAEPTADDAAAWAETAREFCALARDAIAAAGIDVDPADEAGAGGTEAAP